MSKVPRIRMFAGPNGSGKSCLKNYVNERWIGVYVNADEIEKELSSDKGLELNRYKIDYSDAEFMQRYSQSTLANKIDLSKVHLKHGVIKVSKQHINSYYASILASVIRDYLLEHKISFSFETVMSHASKVELLLDARKRGYRTYLYYIATASPEINVNRVAIRVSQGGHPVPEDKIISRYHRSINLLKEAMKASDRSFIFDNSGEKEIWIAEGKDGSSLEFREHLVPRWFLDTMGIDIQ
ncbi:zeta toxin family protein [Rubritalea squalenifaciens]|nr:zeta toxin family protein [Rubritalea squalenifaciens]